MGSVTARVQHAGTALLAREAFHADYSDCILVTNTPTHQRLLTAGTQLGSYAIVRLIAEGGMGMVYEGVHQTLGKRVAVKTLHEALAGTPEVVERFLREGKAAAKIRHPNVLDVIDVALHEGTPYLVMEYLEGDDLGTALERSGAPMPPVELADLIVPIASALSAVHDAGIVHRDLKPENIFLTRASSGAVQPKLLDFGISKWKEPEALQLTGSHVILGTPYYMSPEQAASSKEIDRRSDIFSLGVIMYECAAGERPFKARSLLQLLDEIRSLEPPPLRSIVRTLPAAFSDLIARAMQKDPAARFQSAAEVGAVLLPFASPRVRLNYEREFGPQAANTVAQQTDSLAAMTRAARGSPPRTLFLLGFGALLTAGVGAWWLRSSAEPRAPFPPSASRVALHAGSEDRESSMDRTVSAPVAKEWVPVSEPANVPAPSSKVDAGAGALVPQHEASAPITARARHHRANPEREPAQAKHPSEPARTANSEDDLFRDRK